MEFTASGADIVTIVAVDALNEALDSYQQVLLTHYGQRMRQKLGFMTEQKEDNALLNELFSLMARAQRLYPHIPHAESDRAAQRGVTAT